MEQGYDLQKLTAAINTMSPDHIKKTVKSSFLLSYEQFLKAGSSFDFYLQPLLDIHLHSNISYELESSTGMTFIYFLSVIAFIILIIACTNFMNLATARSSNRAREVGIRKVLGATKFQLTRQFLAESVLLSFGTLFASSRKLSSRASLKQARPSNTPSKFDNVSPASSALPNRWQTSFERRAIVFDQYLNILVEHASSKR